MAVANAVPVSSGRNIMAWSVVGAGFYVLAVLAGVWLLEGEGPGVLLDALSRSAKAAAMLGLGLIVSMAVFGFTSRKRPLTIRTFRNFVIQQGFAIGAFLLVVWCFRSLANTGAMTGSVWAAAVTGATIICIACLGSLATASANTRANIIDDEAALDEMRERGRLLAYSFAWMIGWGALLILLALAGATDLLSPMAVLGGALALLAVTSGLTVAIWRLMDELDHTLSYETGNMSFYLVLILGGGWGMLAHLGFVAAPAPLDWVTMLTVLMFVASFIVLGRRKLLVR